MTRFLTVVEVIDLHDSLTLAALRDRGALEAAVAQPATGLFGGYAYDSLFLQAGVLLHRLAMGHSFVDGNKRTAWLATVTFLEINGLRIRVDLEQRDVVAFMVAVVAERQPQQEIALWLESAIERP